MSTVGSRKNDNTNKATHTFAKETSNNKASWPQQERQEKQERYNRENSSGLQERKRRHSSTLSWTQEIRCLTGDRGDDSPAGCQVMSCRCKLPSQGLAVMSVGTQWDSWLLDVVGVGYMMDNRNFLSQRDFAFNGYWAFLGKCASGTNFERVHMSWRITFWSTDKL